MARAVLAGERGPVRDIVLLNAAAALAAAAGVPGPDALSPRWPKATPAPNRPWTQAPPLPCLTAG